MNREPVPRGAWGMVVRGFLAQNFADALAFGGFGITVIAVQMRYDTSSAVAALGISFLNVAMGTMSPFMATIIDRLTIRRTMYLGLMIAALGYVVLAFAPNIVVFLAAFLLLVGPGAIMMGAFTSSILAANWFASSGRAGQAVGIVNMPAFMMLVPALGVALLSRYGLPGLFLTIAAAHVLMIPVIRGVIDRPSEPRRPMVSVIHQSLSSSPSLTRRQIASRPAFWALALGGALPNAIASAGVAHILKIAVERGHTFAEASVLQAAIGAAAMVGAVGTGTLCDRIGAAKTLSFMGLGLALGWGSLLITSSIPAMAAVCFVIGGCTGGTFTAQSALARQLFGVDAISRTLGLCGVIGLPLLFVLPPLAGHLRDATGGYDVSIIVIAVIALAVTVTFAGLNLASAPRAAEA